MKFPQLAPSGFAGQSQFGMEGSSQLTLRVGLFSRSAGARFDPIGKEEARERAESFDGTFCLEMFPGIEVPSPLLEKRF